MNYFLSQTPLSDQDRQEVIDLFTQAFDTTANSFSNNWDGLSHLVDDMFKAPDSFEAAASKLESSEAQDLIPEESGWDPAQVEEDRLQALGNWKAYQEAYQSVLAVSEECRAEFKALLPEDYHTQLAASMRQIKDSILEEISQTETQEELESLLKHIKPSMSSQIAQSTQDLLGAEGAGKLHLAKEKFNAAFAPKIEIAANSLIAFMSAAEELRVLEESECDSFVTGLEEAMQKTFGLPME